MNTTFPPGDRFHPTANLFPLMEGEHLAALAEDIRANGLREAIIMYQGLILDGRNRHMACERVGVTPGYVHVECDDPLAYVLSKNLHRRHLNESQRAMVAARLAKLDRGRPSNASSEAISQPDAAKLLNVSRSTVQRAAMVRDNAAPELAARVERGEMPVSLAAKLAANLSEEQQRELAHKPEAFLRGAVKRTVRATRELALASATIETSTALGKPLYNVIYADPPWRFEPYSRVSGMDRAADNHYPTMDADALAALELPAADDCVLFCWSTIAMLPAAIAFLGHHGFVYRTAYGWLKPGLGTGYWSRADQLELLLVGVRGAVPAPAPGTQPPQVLTIARGKHSAKPDEFAAMIERMFPNVAKLEMFARKRRAGWDVWGNEVPTATAV